MAAFNAKFENKITAVTVQDDENTATLYSYMVNGGTLNNKGLELLIQYELMKNKKGIMTSIRPFANLTLSDFKYQDFVFEEVGSDINGDDSTLVYDYSGNHVAGVAPVVFNVGLDAETMIGVYGNVNFNYRGKMYFASDQANQAASYGILNAKIGWKKAIQKFDLNIYVGVNNITSQQYYQMVFVNQLTDAYIPAPNEINFFAGVHLKIRAD